MSKFFKDYIYPIATISGSIIGVGFLSLPYITLEVGTGAMLMYFVLLTAVVVAIHVILAEIALKTPDFKRWPGFVGFYFGKTSKRLILIPMIVGSFGVLLAYLIAGSQFLTAIFSPLLGGGTTVYFLAYALVLSAVIYVGVKAVSKFEFIAIILLLLSFVLILVKGFPAITVANIFGRSFNVNFNNFLLPYGAILFSLWGTALIPEAEEMVTGKKRNLKTIVIAATMIPAVIYLFFVFLILGITGNQTTESSLVGVQNVLGGPIAMVVLFIGVITTFTAFIAHGLFLKKMFMYDLKVKEWLAWVIVCFVPVLLYFVGLNSFIGIVSFIGGVLLGIEGVLILLMYKKIGGKKIVIYPLMLVFVVGIIYSVVYSFK